MVESRDQREDSGLGVLFAEWDGIGFVDTYGAGLVVGIVSESEECDLIIGVEYFEFCGDLGEGYIGSIFVVDDGGGEERSVCLDCDAGFEIVRSDHS